MGVHDLLGDAGLAELRLGRDTVAITLMLLGGGGLGGIAAHLVRGRMAAAHTARDAGRPGYRRVAVPAADPRISVPAPRRPRRQVPPPVVRARPAGEPTDPALSQIVAPQLARTEPADPALTQLVRGRHDGGGMRRRG